MIDFNNYTIAYTHSGKFHADDVFSAALIRLIRPDMPIKRVPEITNEMRCERSLIFDIGGGKYDHHQTNAPIRETTDIAGNEMPFAAFGLLWKDIAPLLGLSDFAAKSIDEKFIRWMDKTDNTGGLNTLSMVIGMLNPIVDTDEDQDTQFEKAISIASVLLERMIAAEKSDDLARQKMLEIKKNATADILVFEEYMPCSDVLADTNVKYIIHPSNRGDGAFVIRAMSIPGRSNFPKLPFPPEWRKIRGDKLAEYTKIPTLTFCHNSGFIASANTQGDAVATAIASIEYNIEHQTCFDEETNQYIYDDDAMREYHTCYATKNYIKIKSDDEKEIATNTLYSVTIQHAKKEVKS